MGTWSTPFRVLAYYRLQCHPAQLAAAAVRPAEEDVAALAAVTAAKAAKEQVAAATKEAEENAEKKGSDNADYVSTAMYEQMLLNIQSA
jgi:hypothetical protein